MRPVTLAETADEMEQAARRLHEDGQFQAASELWKAAADLRKALRGLKRLHQSGNIGPMVTAERVRHSKGSTGEDPFRAAVNASHFTIRSLAEKLGVSHALLSQARKGARSIDKALVDEIQKLTGFPATKHNWPKLKG